MEIAQDDLHRVLKEHAESATELYNSLKRVSELRVKRNRGNFAKLELHPSAIEGSGQWPMHGDNSQRARKLRIYEWHRVYSRDDEHGLPRVPTSDDCLEEDDIDGVQILAEAKRQSGVDDKVVAVLQRIKLFENAPLRALAQVQS